MKSKKDPTISLRKEELQKQLKKKSSALERMKRELKIEAALEQVRARTMAMQKSDELPETAHVLYQQFKALGEDPIQITIGIMQEAEGLIEFNVTDWAGGGIQVNNAFKLSIEEPTLLKKAFLAWKEKKKSIVVDLTGKELESWLKYRNAHTGVAVRSKDTGGRRVVSFAFFSKGHISISSPVPVPKETIRLQERFANVFDLTYTRFLDLKNAEAQAREAMIETALERVRSSSMAMHQSNDLMEVIKVVTDQILGLGLKFDSSNFIKIYPDGAWDLWISTPTQTYPAKVHIPSFNSIFAKRFNEAAASGLDFFADVFDQKEKNIFFKYFFEETDARSIPEERKQFVLNSKGIARSAFLTKNIWLGIYNYDAIPFSEETNTIFKRFANVFEQAYIRFLDLLQAEAQARESQIQLALERVRARTMAMQKSNELSEAANLLFQQIQSLDIPIWSAGYCTWDDDDKQSATFWMSRQGFLLEPFRAPLTEDSIFSRYREAFLEGEPFYATEYSGEELANMNRYISNLPEVRERMNRLMDAGFQPPLSQVNHVVYFLQGFLLFVTHQPVPEVQDVFKRFGKVFEQTYTRFLDLKKAEAQARESKVQLAMERVRARTMAMQKSSELAEVATILFQQVKALGVDQWLCGFSIWEIGDTEFTWYPGIPDGHILPPCKISLTEHPVFISFDESRRRGDELFVYEKEGEFQAEHYRYMLSVPGLGVLMQNMLDAGISFPSFQIDHLANFSHGNLAFITYEHFPEMHDIFKRFAKVFEQTYTRFLDLKKAEAQAKESQIEAGLERVRSRAMAMQNSNELAEIVDTVFKELTKLHVGLDRCIIMIYDPKTLGSTWWLAQPEQGSVPVGLFVKYHEYKPYLDYIHAWKNRIFKWEYVLEGNSKKEWDRFIFAETELSLLPDEIIAGMKSFDRIYLNVSFNSFGSLTVSSAEPLIEEHLEILLRFAKVFESTYTRFNDLKQAEEQARESQIQLAMERVRARTMAMQHSDELKNAASLLFKQLEGLGVKSWSSGFNIWKDDGRAAMINMCNPDGSIATPYYLPHTEDKFFKRIYEARQKGDELLVMETAGKELEETYNYMFSLPEVKKMLGGMEDTGFQIPTFQVNHCAFFSQGYLMIITYEPVPEMWDVFKRFANVFEQTYTRFLDLQKSESQAKESQIQLALERVRARTMAMQRSDELAEVALSLFQQVKELGITAWATGFNIWNADNTAYIDWITGPGGDFVEPYTVDLTSHPAFNAIREARQRGDDFFVYYIEGAQLEETYRLLSGFADKGQFQKILDSGMQYPAQRYSHFVFGAQVSLMFITYEPYPEAWDIFKRFGKVFEQTYTRFLDLQKAESQVKESQIEAALERVRSHTMAMQKSDELREVIQVIFEQLVQLDFKVDGAGFGMDYLESDDFNVWNAGPHLSYPAKIHIPYFDHPLFTRFKEVKEKAIDFFVTSLTFEEKNKFWDHFFKFLPALSQEKKDVFYSSPGYFMSQVLLKNVVLYIINFSGNPYSAAENATLTRFGKVFEQTYTRFNDLKHAEAQAIEAIKRASVDRVRAEIASMRTTKDLERITPLIWNELTTLGVPFIRCGVFIMDEEPQLVHTFLSTPDGKAMASFHLPFNTPGEIGMIVTSWQKKEVYKQHWDEAAFIEFTQRLVEQGVVTTGEKYLTENRPTNLYLHFLPFLQGMLYVGDTNALSAEHVQLVQALAEAFSTAYARYEDFNNLESANVKIEKTLTDLKLTQAQLVQSEKMASLGELTAGIAHEIQNPLNFVNNFSEVSNELIAEMVDEVDKGNSVEAKAIAESVKQNLEKILHHGRRADAIVKGMLQHSRSSTSEKEPTNINALAEEYLRLSYQGLRAKDKSFNTGIKTDFDNHIGMINVVPQDIGRVLLNIYNNAFYAVNEKKRSAGNGYDPAISVRTEKSANQVLITVKDNGDGIPQKVVDKIFQPFFTTKPTGQGTGLGLSLSYDIIKAHGGEITVETKEGEGSGFIIQLPV